MIKRLVFGLLGTLFLVIGLIGLILPIIPGAAFIALSLFFYARASLSFKTWIEEKVVDRLSKKYSISRKKMLVLSAVLFFVYAIIALFYLLYIK